MYREPRKTEPQGTTSASTDGAPNGMSRLDEADALHRFHVARETLRNFFVCKEELLWRLAYLLKRTDKRRVAIERCLFSGIGDFPSCADTCACDFAEARPEKCFPGFTSWMDVFYGDAWCITSRVGAWDAARMAQPPRKHARKRPGEAPEQQSALQLIDRSLLRDVGRSAQAFMSAVRALPHFRPVWNAGTSRSGDGAARFASALPARQVRRTHVPDPTCASGDSAARHRMSAMKEQRRRQWGHCTSLPTLGVDAADTPVRQPF